MVGMAVDGGIRSRVQAGDPQQRVGFAARQQARGRVVIAVVLRDALAEGGARAETGLPEVDRVRRHVAVAAAQRQAGETALTVEVLDQLAQRLDRQFRVGKVEVARHPGHHPVAGRLHPVRQRLPGGARQPSRLLRLHRPSSQQRPQQSQRLGQPRDVAGDHRRCDAMQGGAGRQSGAQEDDLAGCGRRRTASRDWRRNARRIAETGSPRRRRPRSAGRPGCALRRAWS